MSKSSKLNGVFLAVVLSSFVAEAGDRLLFKNANINTATAESTMHGLSQLSGNIGEETTHFVVQFKQKISAQDKSWLEAKGTILRYIPNDAYLVKLNEESNLSQLQSNAGVQAVVPFIAPLKIDESFPPQNVFTQNQSMKMLVSVTQEGLLSTVADQLEGAEMLWKDGKYMVIEARLGSVQEFAKVDGIEWIQPYHEPQTMVLPLNENEDDAEETSGEVEVTDFVGSIDNLSGHESGTTIMNFESAWDRNLTGEGESVAMADTGLDSGDVNDIHSDFEGVIGGQVYGLFANSWKDPMGHGTHVAGSVMGSGASSHGQIKGGAYDASMLAQGMWSPLLQNLSVPPELKKLYRKAYEEGARIHTNSWGNGVVFGNYDNMAQMTDEYMWDTPDMLILFAAGNSGKDADEDGRVDPNSIGSPGTAKNVLTVGASENIMMEGGLQMTASEMKPGVWDAEPLASDRFSNNAEGLAVFSSRGPTDDSRLKPEVVAPGTNIVSLCSSIDGSSELWGRFNEDYCFSGGTSMSTPLVAGAAAVTRQYLRQVRGIENPSAALIKGILMNTATDMFPGQFGFRDVGQEILQPAPNNDEGYGRVDMANVVDDARYLTLIDEVDGVADGEEKSYSIQVGDAESVKVTLIYTDAPGSPSAAKSLVNDLDLSVSAGDRTLNGSDSVNNHEQVLVTGFAGETLTVTVKGASLPVTKSGAVPYSVIVTQVQ